MPQQVTIVRAVLRGYDQGTGTADVEAVAGPSALLSGVPVVRSASDDAMRPGAEVVLLLWPDVGGVVLGAYGGPAPQAATQRYRRVSPIEDRALHPGATAARSEPCAR
ncbi:MAG TPA: hypothetical protein GX714_06835 [Chloroflexi bacterium]|jgi:hypothetical protein|nr:hypothetical protein [Chloroflexota bacterium]